MPEASNDHHERESIGRQGSAASPPPAMSVIRVPIRQALLPIHLRRTTAEIRLPSPHGAFPSDFLLRPALVVPDACRLRDDILYACRNSQRTVLVNAANGGLVRLFCAEHVIDEVHEHGGDWTHGSDVSEVEFLRRWRSEYLPLIRVVTGGRSLERLLNPDELARIDFLLDQDPDDVPSATLSMVLEAFYMSNDGDALRAVYGDDFDLTSHDRWLDVLKAGGDAGELARMGYLWLNLGAAAGGGLASTVRRLIGAVGPVPTGLLVALATMLPSSAARRRVWSGTKTAGTFVLELIAEHQQLIDLFQSAAPSAPDWQELEAMCRPDDVLARACVHALARCPAGHRSAAELAHELPVHDVPHGENKVRQTLRELVCCPEVWRGRWQVGAVEPQLRASLRLGDSAPRM